MVNDTAVTILGWLGADPRLATVGEGRALATFRVATHARRFHDGAWQDGPTSWYAVKAWGRLADHCAASLRSGHPVVVHGRLTAEVWRREDGSVASRYVVVADSVGLDLAHGTSTYAPARPASQPKSEGLRVGEEAA